MSFKIAVLACLAALCMIQFCNAELGVLGTHIIVFYFVVALGNLTFGSDRKSQSARDVGYS